MPFIPHTSEDKQSMLAAIGAADIEELFAEIPRDLRFKLPDEGGLSEAQISRIMHKRSAMNGTPLCFAGGGAYDHYIPAAVWELALRGEFYSAYTPYQSEASQGTLQLLYEYQTMMTRLMAMEVANASLYDGASALAEAVLMSVRANRKSGLKKILIPKTVHPSYRKTVKTIVSGQGIELQEVDFDLGSGLTCIDDGNGEYAAVIVPQPNYFGILENVDKLTDRAHAENLLVIAVVNPLLASVVKPPGEWGTNGADIAVGEGQVLGIPLSGGGPYFGFMCTRKSLVRQMPGRIVGRTADNKGNSGFALTLQAREQHIRRSSATSNICTNQGLMVTAAAIHMSIMGAGGLAESACESYKQAHKLIAALCKIAGVKKVFAGDYFHEAVIQLPVAPNKVLRALAAQNIVGGLDLTGDYPELGNAMLVCATEERSDEDIETYVEQLERIIGRQNPVRCKLRPEKF